MKRIFITGMLCIFGILSGCATITTGTDQSLSVITEKQVEGAKCELTDVKGGKWFISDTLGTTSVQKGDGPMTIICKKEGYKTASVTVEETIAGATLGNILIGGGIGIFIDAMTGSAQRYPDQIIVWMEPEQWSSEEERLAWNREKEVYETKIAEQQKAQETPPPNPLDSQTQNDKN